MNKLQCNSEQNLICTNTQKMATVKIEKCYTALLSRKLSQQYIIKHIINPCIQFLQLEDPGLWPHLTLCMLSQISLGASSLMNIQALMRTRTFLQIVYIVVYVLIVFAQVVLLPVVFVRVVCVQFVFVSVIFIPIVFYQLYLYWLYVYPLYLYQNIFALIARVFLELTFHDIAVANHSASGVNVRISRCLVSLSHKPGGCLGEFTRFHVLL